jgi:ATP-binding cassette, subfamily B, bacterial PglK
MLITIKKLFDLLTPREKRGLLLLFVANVGMAGLEMAGIASILPFMAMVTNPDVIHTNGVLKKIFDVLQFATPQRFLIFLGIVTLVLLVVSNLAKALMYWLTSTYDNKLNYRLARRLLATYLVRPYEFFLNRNTSEMGKNVLAEVRTVISGVLSSGMSALSSALICLFILLLLTTVNPFVAIIIIVFLGGCYGLIYLFVRRHLTRISREQVESNKQKYKVAGEVLGGIKELKILGREMTFLDKFTDHARRHSLNNITSGVISQLPRFALEIMAFGGILLIVIIFIGKESSGTAQVIPLLTLYAFAGYRLLPALQQIFAGITTARFNLGSLELLHRDLLEKGGGGDPELTLGSLGRVSPLPFVKELELKKVTFGYAASQEPVLKELSLTIPVNTTIGFVGATGSGKTTTVDILLGLLVPSLGDMLVDGVPVNGVNLNRWQRNLGYVPQGIFLCDDTVTRNIAFGVPEDQIDREAVIRAACIANLDDFIQTEMPAGYETVIGDRGVRLSGGQRQRIGIARALYSNPAVLIMDEATSALDGLTEEAVMEAIHNLSKKKTIIMIAHRLTTVKDCDMIYILDHGRILDQGSYDALQRSSEWFRAAAKTGAANES